jgi:hypothetical protein
MAIEELDTSDITTYWGDNPYVEAGSKAILFDTKYQGKRALTSGYGVEPGDLIVVHKDKHGELITHGKSKIKEGDEIIVVPGKDDDLYALYPALDKDKPTRDCRLIGGSFAGTADNSSSCYELAGTYKYIKYAVSLGEPMVRYNQYNLRLGFTVAWSGKGWYPVWGPFCTEEYPDYCSSCWYAGVGVWVGLGNDGVVNHWIYDSDPWPTIRGPPHHINYPGGHASIPACPSWTMINFFNSYGLSECNYIEIVLHNRASFYFGGTVEPANALTNFTLCKGTVPYGDYGVGCHGCVSGSGFASGRTHLDVY